MNKKIKYPEEITKNKVIGVTATSMGITDSYDIERLSKAYKYLEEKGYKIIETKNVRTNKHFVSSNGKTRAQEFMDLWSNNKIGWIAQASGGEFLMEMLPYINKEVIINNYPKWITGYSDCSLLNFYITTNYNIATMTTTNIGHYGMDIIDESMINQLNILENPSFSVQKSFKLYELKKLDKHKSYNLTEKVTYKHLYNKKHDKISGRLIGGCIDVLSELPGTTFDNTKNFCQEFPEGMLWYLENCEQSILSLYRILWQMKNSGWFNNMNGIIIGRTRSKETIADLSYEDILHKVFDDMNIPVIYDVDFGHVMPQWTMINGSYAEFNYDNGSGEIIEEFR